MWHRLAEVSVQCAKHAVSASFRAWLRDLRTGRSPDRAVLANVIIPALAGAQALVNGSDALWIGCRRYTTRYYRLIERHGARCWTLDFDPDVQRFGRAGRHVVGDIRKLDSLFPDQRFESVFCNGVFGFGIDAMPDQIAACAAMAAVMKPGGWMLLGWNTDRIPDPLIGGVADRWFEPSSLPGVGRRKMVEGCTHVYDVFRRRSNVQADAI